MSIWHYGYPVKVADFLRILRPDVPIPDDGCRAITLLLKYMRRRAKLSSPQLRVCVGWLRGRTTAVFAFGETYALGIPNVLPRPHFLPTDWQVNEVRKMCQARGPPHWFLDGEILYPDRVLAPDTRARTMLYKRAIAVPFDPTPDDFVRAEEMAPAEQAWVDAILAAAKAKKAAAAEAREAAAAEEAKAAETAALAKYLVEETALTESMKAVCM